MIKALREAKAHTSWLSPDADYEAAALGFIGDILDSRAANPFLQSFLPFQARVAELGIYNSLAQLLIKITAPGVPDFYQGTELWDLNLVDPDNRRPVDYEMRQHLLAGLKLCARPGADIAELLAHRADGRVKMFATGRALHLRAGLRDVFEHGEYLPLAARGDKRDSLFAFARRAGDRVAITCVPRLVASLLPDGGGPPLGTAVWGDTRVELPAPYATSRFCDAFSGSMIEPTDGSLAAADIFARFPIALLTPSTTHGYQEQ
jgi:(1->4)-alpha-D-glucan 1-alpha-D-glucosylmutase